MLAWIDLETTGLDADRETVLEVACIVTDDQLNEVARFHAVTDEALTRTLSELDEIVQRMHTDNRLWPESLHSRTTLDATDIALAAFLRQHAPGAQLAGSTISFDRAFMKRHLPEAEAVLHYRNVDVTAFNEVARRYWTDVHGRRPRPSATHRALPDTEDSIAALRYYVHELGPRLPYHDDDGARA